jgi:hypothetical protein
LARLAASSCAAPPDGKMSDRSCKPLGYFGCFTRLRPCCFYLLCCQRGTVTTLVTARDALVMVFWPAKTPTSGASAGRILASRQCAHRLLYNSSHLDLRKFEWPVPIIVQMPELRYPDRNHAAEFGGAIGLLELVYNRISGGFWNSSQTWKYLAGKKAGSDRLWQTVPSSYGRSESVAAKHRLGICRLDPAHFASRGDGGGTLAQLLGLAKDLLRSGRVVKPAHSTWSALLVR